MQTLSEIPELVTCFPCNPKPRPHRNGKSKYHAPRQLVMELMEACPGAQRLLTGLQCCVLQSGPAMLRQLAVQGPFKHGKQGISALALSKW